MMADSLNIHKETIRTILYEALGDETWCSEYDPETKRQSAEWKSENNSPGFIHKELVPTRQTITGQYYLAVLKRLMARIRRMRPEYRIESSCCLLHYNTPSHTSLVRRFSVK
ncbi:HTH_48 domain-containing protein [Trichonephila clavipes]|nr:HTH_48 domain-containing protein [Trichonephila clavipes]